MWFRVECLRLRGFQFFFEGLFFWFRIYGAGWSSEGLEVWVRVGASSWFTARARVLLKKKCILRSSGFVVCSR